MRRLIQRYLLKKQLMSTLLALHNCQPMATPYKDNKFLLKH